MFTLRTLHAFRTLILVVLLGLFLGSLAGCTHEPLVPPASANGGGDDNGGGGDDDGDDD